MRVKVRLTIKRPLGRVLIDARRPVSGVERTCPKAGGTSPDPNRTFALHDDLATFNQVASNDPRHAGNALRPSHPFERGFSRTLEADRLTDNGGQRLVPRQ